jgi:HK97 family phage prohead protease
MSIIELEHRFITPRLTTRANWWADEEEEDEGEDRTPRLTGYASTYGQPYDVEGVREIVAAGAFTRSLRERPDVFALLGHDMGRVIARTKNGSMKLVEDERGLRVEIMPLDTTESRNAFEMVRTGTLDAMSFGFSIREQKFDIEGKQVTRTLTDVELYEVSLVAMPANPNTEIGARSRAMVGKLIVPISPLLTVPPIYGA